MDCVACDKLKKINIDINERIQKAMLYEKYLNTAAVKKFNFNFNLENIFLEYPIILNKFNNKIMHKILLDYGYDIISALVVDIDPDRTVKAAMNEIMIK
jgi:hypothetical protein